MKKAALVYVRHIKAPAWGAGLLVEENSEQRTYLFSDGQRRTFKLEFCDRFIKTAPEPSPEDQARLTRGHASKGQSTPKAVHLEMEADIRRRPDNEAALLVYADWLQTQNDPRGQLIVAQSQLAADPSNKKRKAAEAALLAAHESYLMPPLLDQMLRTPRRKTDKPGCRCELEWRLGFFDHVRVARKLSTQPAVQEVLAELLAHPSASFLRRLTIGPLGDADTFAYKPAITAITKAKPQSLEELVVGDFGPQLVDLAFTTLGNVSPILSALPALERLVLRGGSMRFESPLRHERLRSLSVTATNLGEGSIAKILGAKLPALTRLVLQNTGGTAVILEDIGASPLLERLEYLDLTGGDLTDAAVAAIARLASGAARLTLDVSANRMTATGHERLAKLPNVVAGGSATPGLLRMDEAFARAPDARSAAAAREIARADQWLALGRDRDRLWGEYEGSDHYDVFADLHDDIVGCTCPSPKDPCKHVLALLILAASGVPFPDRPLPRTFVRNRTRERYERSWE